jgi:hypothetical protein
MSNDLKEYYDSLDRLKSRKTKILPRGSLITFDNVAIEAGRAKGSIKANRDVYRKLRIDITQAKEAQNTPDRVMENRVKSLTAQVIKYKSFHEEALVREMSLYRQLMEFDQQLLAENEARNKNKLIPIFRKKNGKVDSFPGNDFQS